MKLYFSVFAGLFFLYCISCNKESFINSADARMIITADTLQFDTVFTSTGSVSQAFRIINDNDRKLRIDKIELKGGNASAFRINADGTPGPVINNLELDANDSVHVFVTVSVNPNTADIPFIIRDSIGITYNGNQKWVQLEAWGQNAHFYREKIISVNETWTNDKPYVILGHLYVPDGGTLTIEKGCRIYVHADAPLVIDGTLKVNGGKDSVDRVYFRGDRLDEPYRNFPAGWPGIYFRSSSKDNVLTYADIRNAYQAIAVAEPAVNANPKITLNQCIIDNAYDAGIIGVHADIKAGNCLISNCGKNILLVQGGRYDFTHCTVASYANPFLQHKNPVLFVSNSIRINNIPAPRNLDAVFRNCIFWGDGGLIDDEVVVEKDGNSTMNVLFDHALMKTIKSPANATLQSVITQAPEFVEINSSRQQFNFRLKPTSPAIDKGMNAGYLFDLDGKARTGIPDLGSYEN